MNFDYQEQLSKNKKQYITLKRLREKLNELGIQRGLDPKSDKYVSISSLDKDSLLKLLTDVQKKKALGLQNKIDRLSVENWKGGKKELISYITKNKLYSGNTKIDLITMDELKQLIINKHKGFSPKKSPVKSSPKKSPVKSSPKKSPIKSSPKSSPITQFKKTSPNNISKREGKIKCKQCGKMVPKVMMLKHLVSRKCKKKRSTKSPMKTVSSDDDTPIKRKVKRRIITSPDDEPSIRISTPKTNISTPDNITTTPIKRKGKRKFLITSPDDEIQTPISKISSPKLEVSAISALLSSPEINKIKDEVGEEREEVDKDEEVGEDETGEDETGEDEVGEDETGEYEVGEEEVGEDEVGEEEVGEEEVGEDEVGEEEVGEEEVGEEEVGEDEEEKVGEDEVGEEREEGEEGEEEGEEGEEEGEEEVGEDEVGDEEQEIFENLDDFEEGDEIKESEEINVNNISSKLMNISEEPIKYDYLIKNTILKSLGLL
jgi:hypothetical protein